MMSCYGTKVVHGQLSVFSSSFLTDDYQKLFCLCHTLHLCMYRLLRVYGGVCVDEQQVRVQRRQQRPDLQDREVHHGRQR